MRRFYKKKLFGNWEGFYIFIAIKMGRDLKSKTVAVEYVFS
jgi:hypothetical protein